MSAEGPARSQGEAENPFKPGPQSPLLQVIGAGSAHICKPDVLHCFNLGVGADLWIGGVLAMYRMKLWKGTSIPTGLNNAFEQFQQWCVENRKTAAIKCFELAKFHMTSSPGSTMKNLLPTSTTATFPKILPASKVAVLAYWRREGP